MHPHVFLRSRNAFTLIELLVVIAIIAILAVVVVLTLNPAELLRQARDTNRLSDLSTLNNAINLYTTDQSQAQSFSLGNASSVYVSLPDTSPTCANLNLPALPMGYTYHCASSTSTRNVDGSGWIPVNLKNVSAGSPLGALPIDPTNQSSTGLYYTYSTDGTRFQILTAMPESTKQKATLDQTPVITGYPGVMAQGSSLSVSPIYNPSGFVGWWSMDEGVGSSTNDMSGNGNNGAWSGAPIGTNGTYYTPGKVGSWAGDFDGTTDYVSLPTALSTNIFSGGHPFTVSAWMNQSVIKADEGLLGVCLAQTIDECLHLAIRSGTPYFGFYSDDTSGGSATSVGVWYYLTFVYTGSASNTRIIYLNGNLAASSISSGVLQTSGAIPQIGTSYNYSSLLMQGSIDDVRIYNRALSAAEVQAIYNAEK